MASFILNVAPLAFALLLCVYVGKWVVSFCIRLFVKRDTPTSDTTAGWKALADHEAYRFRLRGEFHHDRVDNTSWVFRDR